MTNDTETFPEREEIEMLLPWYVTGKLDETDRVRVEAWLKSAPERASQLELVHAEQVESLRSNDAIRAPASMSIERTAVAVSVQGSTGSGAWTAAVARLRELFAAPTHSLMRRSALAAAAVILLQAGVVGYLVSERQGATYLPAGVPSIAKPGAYALVRFADTASAKDIAAALSELGMSVVDGPRQGALFRLRIGDAAMSETDRETLIDTLRRRTGLIVLVTPSP